MVLGAIRTHESVNVTIRVGWEYGVGREGYECLCLTGHCRLVGRSSGALGRGRGQGRCERGYISGAPRMG